ncbi:MAG: hypothetical protein IPP16_04705 [Acidimicrobiaceae bacterium]|nr:hypothetical protein [Acidimicrobiaceae bacterium]
MRGCREHGENDITDAATNTVSVRSSSNRTPDSGAATATSCARSANGPYASATPTTGTNGASARKTAS